MTNWDKLISELDLEEALKDPRMCVCNTIFKLKKETTCYGRTCRECADWLKQNYEGE